MELFGFCFALGFGLFWGAFVEGGGGLPSSADCVEGWLDQPLDHFHNDDDSNHANGAGTLRFRQRYFYNASFFDMKNGPILYYTGNEADVTLYVNATGLMWENAKELGALLVWGEHRYYGQSLPFGTSVWTPKQLRWLTVEQALADHKALVEHVKRSLGAENSKVVAMGGSYGGMLSSWIRMKYPDTFDGAIAGSAPILAFDGAEKASAKHAGTTSYWAIVSNDATSAFGSEANCKNNVQAVWPSIDALAFNGEFEKLGKLLRMCKTPRAGDMQRLKMFHIMAFDNMAMGNFPFPSSYLTSGKAKMPAFPFRQACKQLGPFFNDKDALISAMGRAAAVFNNATQDLPCFDLPADPEYDGVWDYLWCTLTMPQETYFGRDGVSDMFPPFAYNETQINEHCMKKYNVSPAYDSISQQFFGMEGVKNSSNIVFSNGRFDPWRSGGVTTYNSSSSSVWSIIIPNGAHHVDLMFNNVNDTADIRNARSFEIAKIKEWIS